MMILRTETILMALTFLPLPSLALAPKVLSTHLVKARSSDLSTRLRRRDGTFTTYLENLAYFYSVNISVGTPPQYMQVAIDTGSSDLWVPASDGNSCSMYPKDCDSFGSYNISLSSSSQLLPSKLNSSYGGGEVGLGINILETLGFGGVLMENVQIGVVENSNGYPTNELGTLVNGVMGISFESGEAVVENAVRPDKNTTEYTNVVGALVNNKIINTHAYSLYLDYQAALSGSVLFGGVDTEKFEGPLIDLPIPAHTLGFDYLGVQLTSLDLKDGSGVSHITSDIVRNVVLDSGTSVIRLPGSMAVEINRYVGVKNDFVSCNISTCDAALEFGFGGENGASISVPMSELVMSWGGQYVFSDGSEACRLGIITGDESELIILGDTFLRSAYVVYNLDARRIGLAHSNWNVGGASNILEINSTNPIPGAETALSLLPVPTTTLSATRPAQTLASKPVTSASQAAASSTSSLLPATVTLSFMPPKASCTARGTAAAEPAAFKIAATKTQESPTAATATVPTASGTPKAPSSSDLPFTGAAESNFPVSISCSIVMLVILMAIFESLRVISV